MSNWTHVAGIARIDYMPYTDTEDKVRTIVEKIFGKECKWSDDMSVWKKAREHPEAFMPMGSEGSLHLVLHDTNEKDCIARYVVSIFGDLRGHDDPNAIIEWFSNCCKAIDESEDSVWIRNACVSVQNEWNGARVWSYDVEQEEAEMEKEVE